MTVRLLHLYYDLMNLYGEYGNIRILEEHIKDQEFDVTVDKKSLNEEINFEDYDFIYIGCGTERNQDIILQDMLKRKEDFKKVINENKVVLLTGNSYEILGKTINGVEALDILDFEVTTTKSRINEDIIATSDILSNKVVGFVNSMSSIKNNRQPLFKIELGVGETAGIMQEGIIYKNLIGTHLIGPLLIRNPELLKLVIERICKQKDSEFKYKNILYEDEEKGYELVLKELEARKYLG